MCEIWPNGLTRQSTLERNVNWILIISVKFSTVLSGEQPLMWGALCSGRVVCKHDSNNNIAPDAILQYRNSLVQYIKKRFYPFVSRVKYIPPYFIIYNTKTGWSTARKTNIFKNVIYSKSRICWLFCSVSKL